MPKDFNALLIVFFIVPGFLAAEFYSQRHPLKQRSTFDKLILTVVASSVIHLFALPLWLWIVQPNLNFPLPVTLNSEDGLSDHEIWTIVKLMASYFLPTCLAALALGLYLPTAARFYRLPVWTVELVQPEVPTKAHGARPKTAYIIMNNGDT